MPEEETKSIDRVTFGNLLIVIHDCVQNKYLPTKITRTVESRSEAGITYGEEFFALEFKQDLSMGEIAEYKVIHAFDKAFPNAVKIFGGKPLSDYDIVCALPSGTAEGFYVYVLRLKSPDAPNQGP